MVRISILSFIIAFLYSILDGTFWLVSPFQCSVIQPDFHAPFHFLYSDSTSSVYSKVPFHCLNFHALLHLFCTSFDSILFVHRETSWCTLLRRKRRRRRRWEYSFMRSASSSPSQHWSSVTLRVDHVMPSPTHNTSRTTSMWSILKCVMCACVRVRVCPCVYAWCNINIARNYIFCLFTFLQISCLLLTETVEKGKSQEKFGLAENKAGPDREFILQVSIISDKQPTQIV